MKKTNIAPPVDLQVSPVLPESSAGSTSFDLTELREENALLANRVIVLENMLSEARRWMEREVKGRSKEIASNLATKNTLSALGELLATTNSDQGQQGIAIDRIKLYFGDELEKLPSEFFAYLIEAERLYYILTSERGFSDGLPVISILTKAYDTIIHEMITKSFAPYARESCRNSPLVKFRDPLEMGLASMVNKNYTLSIGRLSPLLSRIKEHREYGVTLLPYTALFYEWMQSDDKRLTALLSENLRKKLIRLNESEIFGEKRHRSHINHDEVEEARNLLLGNYIKSESIFRILLECK